MHKKHLLPLIFGIATIVYGVALLGKPAAPQQTTELLNTYCIRCHNSAIKSGDISFTGMRPEDAASNAEIWEKVIRKLRGRMMPPPGQVRPSESQYNSLAAFLEGYIDNGASANAHPGRVPLHRLNRKEYANAVEDLLGITIEPADILPEDDKSDGFDNIASALRASPAFFDQYVVAARSVAVQAVGRPDPAPAGKAYYLPAEGEGKQAFHVRGLPLGT